MAAGDGSSARALGGARAILLAEVMTLVGFVLYLVLHDSAWIARAAVLVIGVLAVLVCVGARLVGSRATSTLAWVAAASALGLLGTIAYLASLDDDSADIPLAGVGVLLVSLVGLVVTFVGFAARGTEAT